MNRLATRLLSMGVCARHMSSNPIIISSFVQNILHVEKPLSINRIDRTFWKKFVWLLWNLNINTIQQFKGFNVM